MLLTEGKLLLWHFIISVVAAVLLLWSAQLTRNFNFTNGHWFPIADCTVYCLLVSRWIIPRLDVTPLPVWGWWHWLMMWGLCHEVSGHPHLACHNLYRMTLEALWALRMMQLGDQFPQASGWRWYSSSVTNNPTVRSPRYQDEGWLSAPCSIVDCDGSNMCDVSDECFELKYNYVDERSLAVCVSISLNSSLIAPSSYNRGLWPDPLHHKLHTLMFPPFSQPGCPLDLNLHWVFTASLWPR